MAFLIPVTTISIIPKSCHANSVTKTCQCLSMLCLSNSQTHHTSFKTSHFFRDQCISCPLCTRKTYCSKFLLNIHKLPPYLCAFVHTLPSFYPSQFPIFTYTNSTNYLKPNPNVFLTKRLSDCYYQKYPCLPLNQKVFYLTHCCVVVFNIFSLWLRLFAQMPNLL